MRRTLVAAAAPAVVTALLWLALERPAEHAWRVAAVSTLALLPALAPRRLPAALAAGELALRLAYGTWAPWAAAASFHEGFLDFYRVRVPFDPRVQPEMRAVVLTAVFAFTLALGVSVAARRPLPAALVVVAGAGWPATLAGPANALGRGAALLAALLALLAALGSRRLPRAAVPVAAVLVGAAVAASTSSAVAKGQLVAWQHWNPVGALQAPVSVAYVWNAQYGGLTLPRKRTTVLTIHAPARSLYWRAAVLDVFAGDRWLQGPPLAADALEPPGAHDRARWVRQDVTVQALADTRLVGASEPVAFAAGDAPLQRPAPGLALLPSGLTRGFRYTAWSYAPQPTAAQLERSRPDYPAQLAPFLEVWPGVRMPAFGEARGSVLDAHPEVARYAALEHLAVQVAGRARSPYAAAAALQRWFLHNGGFVYESRPPVDLDAPLVGFVTTTRAGYCQYFAGAMALMLRYLGVPARVAVGFSSGIYDRASRTWTVTDHDAHAWVEAWFRGYGWLPFDPTPPAGRPERGTLGAAYARSGAPRAPSHAVRSRRVQDAQSYHRYAEAGKGVSAARGGGARLGSAATRRGVGLLLVLLALAAAAAAGIVGAKAVLRRRRYLTRDPRRLAAACRHELAAFLLDQQIAAARSATLHELGTLVREELAVDPDAFVAAATAARFGPPEGAGPAARRSRRELRDLLRRIRRTLTRRERARGLLSLRSLGFVA